MVRFGKMGPIDQLAQTKKGGIGEGLDRID